MSIKVGQKAPDFTLPTDEGENLSLKDFIGKRLFYIFILKIIHQDVLRKLVNFAILGQSYQSLESLFWVFQKIVLTLISYLKKYALPFTLLSDKENNICEKYDVWVDKIRFGNTYKGIKRTTFLIDEKGMIAMNWPNVEIEGHIAEILKKLQ